MIDFYFYKRINNFFRILKTLGIDYKIISLYRSYKEQQMLYETQRFFIPTDPPWDSYHVKGRAVDIIVPDKYKKQALYIAKELGFFARDYENSPHLHIDNRYDDIYKYNNFLKFLILLGGIYVFTKIFKR